MDQLVNDAELAAHLAVEAGHLLRKLRAESGLHGWELGKKGDRLSDDYLLDQLAIERPDDAVLSEESADSEDRLTSERVWIIDPLDGTREYGIPGRPDWAVHVALWESGSLSACAVSQPDICEVYSTADAVLGPRTEGPLRIVCSASRPPAVVVRLRDELGAELIPMGSAGAKAMAVVRGDVDAYVHGGGQWEWDSAAPVGVALAAGLHCSRLDGSPLLYNQPYPYLPDLVICRPEFAEQILEVTRRH